jgi:hypothetical protein
MADERCFDALTVVREACQRHGIDLAVLVAETAIWANPEVHRRLVAENGAGAFFPGLRRARVGAGEIRGTAIDGVRLDDNSGPNQAIKKAIGLAPGRVKGFETCHLWPGTAYDERYHTVIANLVLLPRSLAGLSDHAPEIQAILQYRSFELYSWHPAEVEAPAKPEGYPSCWREPEPFTPVIALTLARRFSNASPSQGAKAPTAEATDQLQELTVRLPATGVGSGSEVVELMPLDERREVISKLRLWATKPNTKIHRILGLITRAPAAMPRRQLADAIEQATGSANGYGAVGSLLTSKGNAYGRVLIERDGMIYIHPEIFDEVAKHTWT